MMDFETARANMIEQQIRPWNVLAMQTLDALKRIRREEFVPLAYRELAFADVQIPLGGDSDGGGDGGGEVMLEPKVSARMMEALELRDNDQVLEIGTGSGYLTALLASVSAHVLSVDIDRALLETARANLAAAGIDNITLQCGDAHRGWAGEFDAILIGGALPTINNSWGTMLADGGRLVGIEGTMPMTVIRIRKHLDGQNNLSGKLSRESLFETAAPRLRNVVESVEFEF